MAERANLETSTTLLRKLGQDPTNEPAWSDFVDRYGRLIYGWCRRWGLKESDAEDVCQNVLLDLAKQMRGYVYDRNGSFRAWLRTVTYRSWCHFVADQRRAGRSMTNPALESLCTFQAGCDFLDRLEVESNKELLEVAIARVRLRVQPRTWEAFRLTAVEDQSGAEVAEHLSMNVGTVFVARSKVQRMLREELQRLDSEDDGA
jgi:RNA polymerase sigma-70 factor (ECF subfamily)